MRKLSFLTICCFVIIAQSSCTKEVVDRPSSGSVVTQNPYTVSYSEWTGIETFTWAEGAATTYPSHEATWNVLSLTPEVLDAGGTVLVFAKSKDTEEVLPMPVSYISGPTDNVTDFYDTAVEPGNIFFTHTKMVDGNYEAPTDLNNVTLRYIIIQPHIFDLGRTPVADFHSMTYAQVIEMLNIPE